MSWTTRPVTQVADVAVKTASMKGVISPLLDEIAEEMDGQIKVAKVNVDRERLLGAMFQVMSIPNVMIFSGGEKVDEFVGLVPKQEIVSRVRNHL